MTSIMYLREEGLYEMAPGEKSKLITGNVRVAELPPGDWRMTKFGEKIIFADASGQSPPMTVDKDGNWETLTTGGDDAKTD